MGMLMQTMLVVGEPAGVASPGEDGKIDFSSNRDGGNPEIYTMSPSGTGLYRRTNDPALDSQPDWQPPLTISSSINATTFYPFKKGSTARLAATVSYCAATDTATLNPTDSLRAGVTYKAGVTGGQRMWRTTLSTRTPPKTGLQQKR